MITYGEHPDICLISKPIKFRGVTKENQVIGRIYCGMYRNVMIITSIKSSSNFMNTMNELDNCAHIVNAIYRAKFISFDKPEINLKFV